MFSSNDHNIWKLTILPVDANFQDYVGGSTSSKWVLYTEYKTSITLHELFKRTQFHAGVLVTDSND